MVTDIVCGKKVDEQNAIMTKHGDRPFYFCSEKCENNFVGDPIRYIDPTGAVASTAGSPKITADGKRVPSRV